MTRWLLINGIILSAPVLLAPVLIGCSSKTQNHDQWVSDADQRWRDLMSGQLLEMAQGQFDTGDLDQAEKSVRDGLRRDPRNAQFHILGGRIALERGQLERSFHRFSTAIDIEENLAPAHYYQGVVMQRWQKFDLAYDHYAKACEIEPDSAAHLMAMGEMLVSLDRTDEAIELIEQKLEYFDQNAALRVMLGHLCIMKDRADAAVTYFREASILIPDEMKIREELALAQVEAGQYRQAIPTLRELFGMPQMNGRPDLQRALATAYAKTGRVKDARELYRKLTRGEVAIASDWIKLGELALQAGDRGAALYASGKAMVLDPQEHEGYLLAGLVWQQRDRLPDALRMFDRAGELAPRDAEPLILRGVSLQKAGEPAAARDAYTEALRRDPTDTRARKLLAAVAAAGN